MIPRILNEVIIFCLLISVVSCKGDHNQFTMDEDNYSTKTEDVAKMEYAHPAKFITVKSSNKKNLLGQTVVRANVFNTAKVATFKDIEMKLQFFSKTGVVLEEDIETVYEKINAGGSTKFKSKFFSPKGSDSVSITVLSAKPAL